LTNEKTYDFVLRPPTLEDIPATVAMLNECWLESVGTTSFTNEQLHAIWHLPDFDFPHNVRLAVDSDGQILGYCIIFCRAPFLNNYLMPRTHPAYRNRGIGTALTAWGEARSNENLALAPPDARVIVGCSNFGTHVAGAQLLVDRGYHLVRSGYEMKIEMASAPPAPQWPANITVRGMQPDHEEEAVYRAIEETFRDHWGHVERPFAEGFAEWLHLNRSVPVYDPAFFFVAWDGAEIAGVALCFTQDTDYPDMAWIQSLGVRRPWRRQGLALALLHHIFGEAYRRGIPKVGLGVDAESLTGATWLYEKAGMHIFRQWDTYEKELRPGVDLVTRQVAD